MSDGTTPEAKPDQPTAPDAAAAPPPPPPVTPPYAAPPLAAPSAGPPAGYPGVAYGAPPAAPAPGYSAPQNPYGAPPPPYGGPPAPYGAAPPYARPRDARPKVLAILGLVSAIAGALMAFIPFITFFSGLFLLAGLVLSLIALLIRTQGGKGFAIGGLVTSIVGGLVALIMTIVSFAIIGAASSTGDAAGASPAPRISEEATENDAALSPAEELVLTETAFGRESFDSETWWYVVVLDNPNADYIFDFANVSIEALDANGTILDTSDEYLTILGGKVAVTGNFLSVGQNEIARLDVRGPLASSAILAPAEETGTFAIADVVAATDEWSTTVRGTVSGSFDVDQEGVQVTVIARAADGRIVGGDWTYVDRVPADGTRVQFETTFLDPLPADTVFEAYAML